MKITGIFAADFDFTMAEVHFGQKDGQDYAQISFVQIGDMNNETEGVVISETTADCTFQINGFPCLIHLEADGESYKGSVNIEAAGFFKELTYDKVSDDAGFAEHRYVIPKENLENLRAHVEYDDIACEPVMTYELNNPEVLAYIKDKGIDVDNHQDFATVCELMKKTCELISHDGVNYRHDDENYGTIAQMEQAAKQNNYTNCRGVAIILAGVLRAYGFPANVVECCPADTESIEIHVVCEAYIKQLGKTVLLDPSHNLVYFNNGVPVSLMELRNVLVEGNLDGITLSEGSSHNGKEVTIVSLLGYLSKNMMYFRKAIHSDESSEIIGDNVICLAPKDLLNSDMDGAKMTCNIREFYPEVE